MSIHEKLGRLWLSVAPVSGGLIKSMLPPTRR